MVWSLVYFWSVFVKWEIDHNRGVISLQTVSIMKFCRVFQLENGEVRSEMYMNMKHDRNNLGQGNITMEHLKLFQQLKIFLKP